jgi:hypothetical protein
VKSSIVRYTLTMILFSPSLVAHAESETFSPKPSHEWLAPSVPPNDPAKAVNLDQPVVMSLGGNPEEQNAREAGQAKASRELGERLARLIACYGTGRLKDRSTLEWYLGNTLNAWNSDMSVSGEALAYDRAAYEKAFIETLTIWAPKASSSVSAQQLVTKSSSYIAKVEERLRQTGKTYRGAASFLTAHDDINVGPGEQNMRSVVRAFLDANADSLAQEAQCRTLTNAFWETPTFHVVAKAKPNSTARSSSAEKSGNSRGNKDGSILHKIIPFLGKGPEKEDSPKGDGSSEVATEPGARADDSLEDISRKVASLTSSELVSLRDYLGAGRLQDARQSFEQSAGDRDKKSSGLPTSKCYRGVSAIASLYWDKPFWIPNILGDGNAKSACEAFMSGKLKGEFEIVPIGNLVGTGASDLRSKGSERSELLNTLQPGDIVVWNPAKSRGSAPGHIEFYVPDGEKPMFYSDYGSSKMGGRVDNRLKCVLRKKQ